MITLDELLTDTATVADPDARTLARGRAVLMEATAGRPQRTRSRRNRRIAVVAAGVAAAVVVPAVSLTGGSPSSSAAAEVFHKAGVAARNQPGGWPAATYWHSVATYTRNGHVFRREIWLGHHTSGVLVDAGLGGGKTITLNGPAEFPAGSIALSWDQLYRLPTDPSALKQALRGDINGAGPNDDAELFTMVGDLLRESPAPPALRSALYEVAATVPHVTVLGTRTDSAGRTGTALERDGQEYLIDTTDGQLLQESEGGSWSSTYLEQGPAAAAPS